MTVGTYNGAEGCRIVELFMLDKDTKELNSKNIGCNRDEFSTYRNKNGTVIKSIKLEKYN